MKYMKYAYEAEIITGEHDVDGLSFPTVSACGHRHRTMRAALACAEKHGHTGRVHVCLPDGTVRNITASEWDSDGDSEQTQRNIEQ